MDKQNKICPFITRYPDETECFEERCMAWGCTYGGQCGGGKPPIPANWGCKLISWRFRQAENMFYVDNNHK